MVFRLIEKARGMAHSGRQELDGSSDGWLEDERLTERGSATGLVLATWQTRGTDTAGER